MPSVNVGQEKHSRDTSLSSVDGPSVSDVADKDVVAVVDVVGRAVVVASAVVVEVVVVVLVG